MNDPILLTADEAAALLSVCRTTLYSMITEGELPDITIGGVRRIPRHAVEELAGNQASKPEPKAVYTLKETADLLRVSRVSLQRWMTQGLLPFRQIRPRCIRVPGVALFNLAGLA